MLDNLTIYRLFVGEALVDVDEDQAREYQEKLVEEKQEEIEKLNDLLDEAEGEMKVLKTFLYARFGSAINLEEN